MYNCIAWHPCMPHKNLPQTNEIMTLLRASNSLLLLCDSSSIWLLCHKLCIIPPQLHMCMHACICDSFIVAIHNRISYLLLWLHVCRFCHKLTVDHVAKRQSFNGALFVGHFVQNSLGQLVQQLNFGHVAGRITMRTVCMAPNVWQSSRFVTANRKGRKESIQIKRINKAKLAKEIWQTSGTEFSCMWHTYALSRKKGLKRCCCLCKKCNDT